MAEKQTTELKTSMAAVAQEMFGDKFIGEVPAEKPVAEPAKKPAEEAATEEPAEEPVKIEEEAPEPVEAESPEAEASEIEEEEAPSGEVDISTLSELVEHYELDHEWAKGLKVPVKINGTDSSASIDDLVASYQIGEAADARLDDAKTKAQAIMDTASGQLQNVNNQAKIVASLIDRAETVVDQDATDIDWKHLRQNDPAEYSAKKADIEERRKTIENLKTDALGEYQKVIDEQNETMAGQRANMARAEQTKLLEKLPEWSDPKTAKAEKGKITQYLTDQGFSGDEIGRAVDHRIILLARKAMLYDSGTKKAGLAKKKVAKIPKVMKPGSPKPEDQRKTENIDRLRAKAKKSGSMADGLELLRAKRRA